MFEKIGSFAAKFRYPIVAAWIALVVIVLLFAPDLADVVTSDQSSYLPADEASVIAAEVAAEYFPDQASPSQAVLVIQSTNGPVAQGENLAYLADLTAWLEDGLPDQVVGLVLSPTDPDLAERLVSDDGRVAMIFVGLLGADEDPAVLAALDAMRAKLEEAPAGLKGYVTGSAAIVNDYMTGALESADRTTIITIFLVIIILLLIYRTPVAPIVPLITIGVALLVTRGVVAWLGQMGMVVSSITDVFLVVLLFGAGTDYCLFLVSRFREYTADDLPGPESARRTVGRVGETITSSAGTVIVGMMALSFADMKLFASTGPSLALGVGIALIAGLTLTPALLAILGKWAFWPGGAHHAKHGGWWGKLAHWVTARPWVPLILGLLILVPLTLYGRGATRSFDLLSDLPDDVPSKAGFNLLSEKFGAGEMQPLDVIITDIPDPRSPEGMAHVDEITQRLLAVEGVADVRSLTLPAGQDEPELAEMLRVEEQLRLMAGQVEEARARLDDPAALADAADDAGGFDLLRRYLDDLAAAFPDLADDANYRAAVAALDDLEGAMAEGQERLLVHNQLAEAAQGVAQGLDLEAQAPSAEALDEAAAGFAALRGYLTGLAEAQPTVSEMEGYTAALDALDRLEATLAEIQDALLVSTQLDLLAQGLNRAAALLQDPAALEEMAASPDQTALLGSLDAYLQELTAAYPALAGDAHYRAAVEHLDAVNAAVDELAQAALVGNQLALIAQGMDDTLRALEENPLALLPQPGEPDAAEQMSALAAYLEEMGAAYPSLAATEDYQTAMTTLHEMAQGMETLDLAHVNEIIAATKESLTVLSDAFHGLSATAAETLPDATFTPEELPPSLAAMAPDLTPIAQETAAAGEEFAALAETVRREMPEAILIPETELPAADATDPLPALEAAADDLAAALDRLASTAAEEIPDAAYIPESDLLAGEMDAALDSLRADLDAFHAALMGLADGFAARADGFFIPEALAAQAGEDLTPLLDTYSTADGRAARLQVVLADDPFSREAMNTVETLREEVRHASAGYVSGSTATNLDLREVMDRDFVRIVALVIGGIFIVLILLLRSLVAPIYMMLTILLSYGATMGLARLVFEGIYGRQITWFMPFLLFVVLVALGMDYNIFLMGRVKEEVATHDTRTGIERAVERTGGIITSAGIIMAGTFAAMMSSSLMGLVQIAFAVTVGVLLDTFVIRTTLMPAIATLLGRWNWWPGKGPH